MFQDALLMPALPGAWKLATGLPAPSVTVTTTGLHASNGGAFFFSLLAGLAPLTCLSPCIAGVAAPACAVSSPSLFLFSSAAQALGTLIALASEYAIAGPLGGLGVLNSPGAGPMWRAPDPTHSVPCAAGNRWNASFAIFGCHCSSASMLSRIHKPRPCVAITRS